MERFYTLKVLKPFYKKHGCLTFDQKGFLVDQFFQAHIFPFGSF
jgi:hypothetical protein